MVCPPPASARACVQGACHHRPIWGDEGKLPTAYGMTIAMLCASYCPELHICHPAASSSQVPNPKYLWHPVCRIWQLRRCQSADAHSRPRCVPDMCAHPAHLTHLNPALITDPEPAPNGGPCAAGASQHSGAAAAGQAQGQPPLPGVLPHRPAGSTQPARTSTCGSILCR